MRHRDGSAGDADYGRIGHSYGAYRQPDPRIAAMIEAALGPAATVLNVGAGAGSYEPTDRRVTAVEPSASMRAQRPPHLAPAIDAVAERLPFDDDSFDAAMATFTIHQWTDLAGGLGEMRRVTRGPVVILTCDPLEVEAFWLNDYAPEVLATEARRYPAFDAIAEGLGTPVERFVVPIPFDCRDGFNEAYYGVPRCCSTRRPVSPARPGASSPPATLPQRSPLSLPALTAAPGMTDTAHYGRSPITSARSTCWSPPARRADGLGEGSA